MRKLLLVLLFISVKSFGQTLETDRLALVAIYNQANGSNWMVNWVVPGNPGDSPCGWDGVTCAGGRVTRLNIFNPSAATLAKEIGNLTELTHLDIATEYFGPGFVGTIPSELSNLTKLEYLNILGNNFNVSEEYKIGSLTSLKELHMTAHGDVPASFVNLVNLERCIMGRFGPMDGTVTMAFPNLVCQWPKIRVLRMAGVEFTTAIPSQIGNLTTLDTLELTRYNGFSSVSVAAGGNIPSEMGNLVNLKYLNISYNGLTGSIPASFNNLTNLTKLDLSFNKLTGPIPNILGIPASADVRINDNAFNFSGMEANISRLDAYGNQEKFLLYAYLPLRTSSSSEGARTAVKSATLIAENAGGIKANNTYKWYKEGVLIATTFGDDNFFTEEGLYRVEVTNSMVPGLTLVSADYLLVILPVTLASFDGKAENNQTKLTWKTTSETNNKGFEIERSADARNFEKIGFVDGSGDTKENQFYHFTDLNPLATGYYRLKQLDYDGKFEYSKVISVKSEAAMVKVYPNPAQEYLTVSGISEKQPLSIVDQNGRVVLKGLVGEKERVNISTLGAGRYIVKVGEESTRLLINK